MKYHSKELLFIEIKSLISKGQTKEAIELYIDELGASDKIIIISNRFYQLKTKSTKGIISNEEESRALNILNDDILNILSQDSDPGESEDIEFNIDTFHSKRDHSFITPTMLMIGVMVILGLLIIFSIDAFFQDYPNSNDLLPISKEIDYQPSVDSNIECIEEIIEEKHSIFWSCINTLIKAKELEKAKELLQVTKSKINDAKKISDINSKINDIEIIEEFNLDYAEGYFNESITISSLEEKKGLITKDGKVLFDPIFESVDPQMFYPMIEIVKYGKIGFVDITGNYIHYPKFEFANPQEFYPLVSVTQKSKIGFLNRNGDLLIDPIFDSVQYENEGMIGVLKNNKWGFIDTLGELKINNEYDYIDYFEGGITKVRKNHREYIINKNGEIVDE